MHINDSLYILLNELYSLMRCKFKIDVKEEKSGRQEEKEKTGSASRSHEYSFLCYLLIIFCTHTSVRCCSNSKREAYQDEIERTNLDTTSIPVPRGRFMIQTGN